MAQTLWHANRKQINQNNICITYWFAILPPQSPLTLEVFNLTLIIY